MALVALEPAAGDDQMRLHLDGGTCGRHFRAVRNDDEAIARYAHPVAEETGFEFRDADQPRGSGHERPEHCMLDPAYGIAQPRGMSATVECQDEWQVATTGRQHPDRCHEGVVALEMD